MHTPFEKELAQLLIQALDLEDIGPEDIAPEAPLFGFTEPGSLGLDSIDALEIALALGKTYGVQLKADDERNKETFRSLRSLAQYIQTHKP
ncbi:MAG: acyl carrier protein [Moraxellaceae bacterium]|nr:MAG: acyl carrier protein [Moraxellaceae bacterium]